MAKTKVDPVMMQNLLDEPTVRGKVKRMKPETLAWFKQSLVDSGVYGRYVWEQQKKQIKEMLLDTVSPLQKLGKSK